MRKRNQLGFSLLEIMIVVALIGILATLAIPLYSTFAKKARFSALANDLRVYSEAFQTYATEVGDYPASFTVPDPDFESGLSNRWGEVSPVGGAYSWVYTVQPQPDKRSAFIQISPKAGAPYTITQGDFILLDEKIDDGNIASGYLQLAGMRIRYYLKLPKS